LATIAHVADPVVIGLAFGVVLLAVAAASGPYAGRPALRRPGSHAAWSVGAGLLGGIVLVGLAVLGGPVAAGGLVARSTPLVPWAVATVVVAWAEEAVLRGALFDAIGERAGLALSVGLTSVAFALMHVPLYGWHVVPLDLGVGLWLAGLRLLTGGIAAPSIAHAVADLATYWL
jgi:membrane protease YdiL (CAAX protease family)